MTAKPNTAAPAAPTALAGPGATPASAVSNSIEVHGGVSAPPAPAGESVPAGAAPSPDDAAFQRDMAIIKALADGDGPLTSARAVADAILEAIDIVVGAVKIDVQHIDTNGRLTTAAIRLGGA